MPYQKKYQPSQDLGTKRCTLSRKRKTKFTRKSVLKMLAVMAASQNYETGPSTSSTNNSSNSNNNDNTNNTTDVKMGNEQDATASPQDFLQSGRTGRRNALADILSEHAVFTSSDLPGRLQKLTTTDSSTSKNSTKSSNDGEDCSKSDGNS